MNRRTLLISAAALTLAPAARASDRVFYTPGLAEAALEAGETVVLDFWTDWCSTCAAQQRVLAALKAGNPDYEAHLRFITVDWDQHGRGPLSRALAIPRRSTLVALKGRQELGRIVAGTAPDDIAALLDRALHAARA
ncbi:thioredoxin family protein (plasmid) [Paracoccus liaowanqingii]|uniref:Thioredoxin family protein n=1 Tax=Paracoccus liaowanqingii TaxID=2560053 RepID=A0A4Y5SVA7_9RHOB|nr:thioredoxin family protein [Paracoccus liaowanqingii]QDA36735.1 thioredoxin family protein [Paracoccus liaowanqingii]